MEAKYYTPTIEEFYIGFEYEWLYEYEGYWIKEACVQKDFVFGQDDGSPLECLLGVRVKHLDAEDIESFDFKHIGSQWYEKDQYRIARWSGFQITIWCQHHLSEEHEVIFIGDIKNKSELKTILKMVGVIKT